jgi:hypothetical protein
VVAPSKHFKREELKPERAVNPERDQLEEQQLIQQGYVLHDQPTGPLVACNGCISDSLKGGHELTVKVAPGTNVIFTLIDYKTSGCVRKVYIKGGETYVLKDLPDGYFVGRELYGEKLYRKDKKKGNCEFAFAYSAMENYTPGFTLTTTEENGKLYRELKEIKLEVVTTYEYRR